MKRIFCALLAGAHEDPGFEVHRSTLRYWGLRPVPVPVDAEGLCVEQLSAFPEVRGVLVTPSHQYPLGMLMSRQRREALIRWASAHKAWIIEDDYDNELSYAGSPTTALAAIAEIQSSVVYLGSFSKMIYPGFGLGYLVAQKVLRRPSRAPSSYQTDMSPKCTKPFSPNSSAEVFTTHMCGV